MKIYLLLIIFTPAILYSQGIKYIGAGTTDGVIVTASSGSQGTSPQNTIDASGMDALYMEATRLLAQASLGFEEEHVQDVIDMGIEGWIDAQLNTAPTYLTQPTIDVYNWSKEIFYANTPNPTESADFGFLKPAAWRDFYPAWWVVNSQNEDLLRQRVALALSEIFVISTETDLENEGLGVADYYDMLLDHSFGNFRDLLYDVTTHACMGYYLSHLNNPKTDLINNIFPDENYAREIMQLFTIGLYELHPDGSQKRDNNGQLIPTYDNGHIKELAKVFTGLSGSKFDQPHLDYLRENNMSVPDPAGFGYGIYTLSSHDPMIMYDEWHERGRKTIVGNNVIPSGQTGIQDVNMALDILFNHDNVGPFIGKQLIQRLVKSNPSPDYILRITDVFNNNGGGVRGDLKAVVRAILLDEEARSCEWQQDPHHGKLREPLIKFLHLARNIGYEDTHIEYFMTEMLHDTKQDILRSPSVFNFFLPSHAPVGPISESGLVAPEFQIYDSQTSVGYANKMHSSTFWNSLYFEPFLYEGDDDWDNKGLHTDLGKLRQFDDDDEALINHLDKVFTHGRLSDRTRQIIRNTLRPMRDWDPMYMDRIRMALYLVLISPDYNILK